jgi:hypothetical protein
MTTDNDPNDQLTYRYPRTTPRPYSLFGIEHYRKPRNWKRWLIFISAIALYALIYWRLL